MTMDATAAERGVAAFSKKAGAYVGSIGSELKSQLVGAFAAGAVISAVRSFGAHVVETVDNIKDMSEQLGVSTDEIQRMQKAANDAGVKFTVISGALQRIDALRSQAASGDKAASGLFAGLGIDPTQGTALDVLTQAVEASARGARENALLFDMVGRKAGILKGIVGELKGQGPIELISERQIQAIDKANASLEEAKRRVTAAASGPMAAGLDVVARQINQIKDGVSAIGETIKGIAMFWQGSPSDEVKSDRILRILKMGDNPLLNSMFGGSPFDALSSGKFDGSALPLPTRSSGVQSSSFAASTPAASAISLGQPGDSLSRIGLFVGGRPEVKSLASIERNTADAARSAGQQTRILKSIEDLLKLSADQI